MNPMRCNRMLVLAAVVVAVAGCESMSKAPRAPARPVAASPDALGRLTPEALRAAYGTPALVVRQVREGRHAGVQGAALPADTVVDDRNLVIFAEGAGDTVEGFRWTARLLAESPYTFPGQGRGLVIILAKWSQSTSAVAEHLNHEHQAAGAAHLAEMLEIHHRRHGARGCVSLIGFSAGTRVIEMALRGAVSDDAAWYPQAFRRVRHVVFLGSSLERDETVPCSMVRGRLLNFVNPRDTHFGDRAAYVAPAGGKANLLNLLKQTTITRRPHVGVSATGFLALATLTTADQFDALADLEATGAPSAAAFKQINVPVPRHLVPYGLFGQRIKNDDLDDYLNQAPNHYILVGRGPGGRTEAAGFSQYRASAEEFIREHVASAALEGRLHRFHLEHVPEGAGPLNLPIPLPVPWAVFSTDKEATDDAPPAPAPPID